MYQMREEEGRNGMMQLFFALNGIGRKMISGTLTFARKMKNTLAVLLQIEI
jgi:hypothetical protein